MERGTSLTHKMDSSKSSGIFTSGTPMPRCDSASKCDSRRILIFRCQNSRNILTSNIVYDVKSCFPIHQGSNEFRGAEKLSQRDTKQLRNDAGRFLSPEQQHPII
eukprot:6179679-Pleurochrysis_carterae.AAC.1